MIWNYRVMATEYKGDIVLQVHEVYYNDKGVPSSYSDEPSTIGGENIEEIKDIIQKLEEAANRPILWTGEKFPDTL